MVHSHLLGIYVRCHVPVIEGCYILHIHTKGIKCAPRGMF
jgi:hypothetical protein